MILNKATRPIIAKGSILLLLTALIVGAALLLPSSWQLLLIVALIGGILLFFLMLRPEWAIYFLIIFIPLEEFLEKWIPRGKLYESVRFGGEALLLALFVFVILDKIRRGFRWYKTPVDIPLLIFLGAALVSAILNDSPPIVAVLGIRPLIRYALVFYILTQLRVTRQFFERCFTLSLFMATLVAIIGLMQTMIGSPLTNLLIPGDVVIGGATARAGLRHIVAPRTYIFSTMGRYDTLGTFLLFFLLLATGAFVLADRQWRKRILPFLIVGFPAFALTFSRQSWLGLVVGVGIMVLISRWREFQRTRLLYFSGAILVPLLILLALPYARYFSGESVIQASLLERALEPFSQRYFEISRYSYGRLFVIVEVGSRLLKIAPFFGVGPGQFGSLTARFFNIPFWELVDVPENAAHFINDVNWILILGQVGLIGTLSFLWIFLSLFWTAYKRYFRSPVGIIRGIILAYSAIIIVYLLIGFFGPNFEVRQISFYVWLWGGLIMGLTVKSSGDKDCIK